MSAHRSQRIAAVVAGSCLAGGLGVVGLDGSATAASEGPGPARGALDVVHPVGEPDSAAAEPRAPEAGASMSSPYIPGVPHVPSDVLLVMGEGGSLDGSRFVGPEGSLFNGPVDEVEDRVDAWWAEQMAAGLTPEEADALLADH
ncbi:hypothetical protein GCM10009788_22240 [Nocardioides humi]|uniref:Uncharacterized protein n=1 Tax=Nocardioides humi TaxID=449461 RepID=A0ABN2AFN2_9ACTN